MLKQKRLAVVASALGGDSQSWRCPVCNESRTSAAWQPRYLGYVRCPKCGLLADYPLPSSSEINEYYPSRARTGNYSPTLSTFDDQRKAIYRTNLRRWSSWTGRLPPADLVTMTDLIEHVADPETVLKKAATLLRPGGHILLTTPDTGSVSARVLRSAWPQFIPVHHLFLFNRRNVKRLLERCGFAEVRFRALWKTYSLRYMKWILPHLNSALVPFTRILPDVIADVPLPLNGGEMIVIASRKRELNSNRIAYDW